MFKILKYSFFDLMRSRWSYVYFAFYLLLGFILLFLNTNLPKAVITLMNIIVVLTPLIGTLFGVMYYYNSREFTELLLSLPIRRRTLFLGQYIGLALSLSISLVLGLGIPFVIYGIFQSGAIWDFVSLLFIGTLLTFIFTALSTLIALANENKIKGFGYAILMWLFMAVVYDGMVLIAMMVFSEYPLDNLALGATVFNPIDLSRILIILKLDISSLLSYTGAVFKQFFGSGIGILSAFGMLVLWVILPVWRMLSIASKKDF